MRVIDKSFLSANQQYKLSGSVLPFKDWINREKEKGEVIPKSGVTDVIQDAIETDMINKQEKEESNKSKTILGLSKPILMLSALVIVGAVAYKYYYKK
tara:strand:- start:10120 stop:10413 length:294 start_codon:yes stop_codon:yes gene_type:complete